MLSGVAVLDALAAAGRVLLTGPEGPDGDSLGACLALARVLRRSGVVVDVAGSPAYRYAWMPGADAMIADQDVEPGYDAVAILDGDRHRLAPRVLAAFDAARTKAIVDHHASTRADGYDLYWVDAHAPSTCEMLWDALRARGDDVDRDLATLLYVGAVFDTGGFRYSNTTPHTHRMAAEMLELGLDHADVCARVLLERSPAGLRLMGTIYADARSLHGGRLLIREVPRSLISELGASDGDLEGIVDAMVFTVGCEVSSLVIEKDDRIKLSLRSRGRVDVAAVAQSLTRSGGGHRKAAGASLYCSLGEASALVESAVGRALAAGPTE